MSGNGFNSAKGTLFQALCPIYLASASPRRQAFLKDLGIPFTVLLPDPSAEPPPCQDEHPETFALRAARAKSQNIATKLTGQASGQGSRARHLAVIAADTVVSLDGNIFGKPLNKAHAFSMLKALSGRTHQVTTACSVLAGSLILPPNIGVLTWKEEMFSVTSEVTFWEVEENLLRAYSQSSEPMDKAGAYAVQGLGAFLAKHLSGSWTNIVGLPLAELCQTLLRLKIIESIILD